MTLKRFPEGLGWWAKGSLISVLIIVLIALGITISTWNTSIAPQWSSDPDAIYLQALKAADSGDYATAYAGFRQLAEEHHDRDAQFNLGALYELGLGVSEPNMEKVLDWWLMAAYNGHPIAQFNLGVIHDVGRDVPPNPAMAYVWYSVAADNGEIDPVIRGMAMSNREILKQRMDEDALAILETHLERHLMTMEFHQIMSAQ